MFVKLQQQYGSICQIAWRLEFLFIFLRRKKSEENSTVQAEKYKSIKPLQKTRDESECFEEDWDFCILSVEGGS